MYTAIRLEADAASAARARRSVEWFAAALDTAPGLAPLVTTELVSNAVRHGAEPIVLLLRAEGEQFIVEVTDCGAGRVPPRGEAYRGHSDEGGFGLALVARVALEWGVRRQGSRGKTVWARLAAERASAVTTRDVEVADRLVSERGLEERLIAAQERDLSDLEQKLAQQIDDDEALDLRAAAMHRAAASVHAAAALLHERLAGLADQRTQRLVDRYG